MEKTFPHLCFVRYADDIIVHCNSQIEAENVLTTIKGRLGDCKLELNERKTKIVYCKSWRRNAPFKTVKFDFLGFSFQPRPTASKDGGMFLGYDCSISIESEKKIANTIRETNFQRWTHSSITRIADYFNPKIRGWLNYYGKFRKYNLMRIFSWFNWRLIKWAVRRFKRFHGSMRQAGNWVRRLAKCYPYLFIHWQQGFQNA
jgi:RNA-directed DNA polymerase